MQQGTFTASEPEELERFSAPWDLMIDSPLAPEPCAEVNFFGLSGLTVMQETYRRPARLLGMPPPNELVMGIPIGAPKGSTAYGRELRSNQIYCLVGTAMEARYQTGQQVMALHLDLAQDFDDSFGLALDRLLSGNQASALGQPAPETARLVGRLRGVLANDRERQTNDGHHSAQAIGQDLMSTIVEAVLPERLDAIEGKSSLQSRAVSMALEYLRASSDCTSVADLCAGAGISQRTLARGVRAHFDCTVVQLLQKWRLHKARQGLVLSGPQDTTVSRIAATHGFYDFGRFASRYASMFGEYPSDTLAAAQTTTVAGPLVRGSRLPSSTTPGASSAF